MATQSSQPPPSSSKRVIPFETLLCLWLFRFLKGLLWGNDELGYFGFSVLYMFWFMMNVGLVFLGFWFRFLVFCWFMMNVGFGVSGFLVSVSFSMNSCFGSCAYEC